MNKNKKEKTLVVGINASFIRKPDTGIGQVTLNFLQKLAELGVSAQDGSISGGKSYPPAGEAGKLKVILYLEEDLPKSFKLPKNFEKRIFLPIWRRDDLIRKIWWEKYLLPRCARKDSCSVFISLYQCPTVFYGGEKHIMLVHDIIPKLFPEYLGNSRKKLYWRLTKKGIAAANRIITISKRTEKDLVQKLDIPSEKITTSYIDVDPIYKKKPTGKEKARVLKKYRLKPGYILAGGGMEVRKNVEGVVRAYQFLRERFKNEKPLPKLVIYGKLLPELAPLATDVEKLVKELNLTKSVKLLGRTPQKDLPALFANAEVFVYPSRYEGFGLPVLEAMNAGTPVIAGKTSSLPEVGGDSILYCHPDDIHDIAMVIRNVLLNKNLRETLAARGRERSRMFSWGKFTKKVLNIAISEK